MTRTATLFFVLVASSEASAQTTTGVIQGAASDAATGAPLALVTVVATSPALQGQAVELTDGAGLYRLSELPAGTYGVLFIYGDARVKRDNVEVGVGAAVVVNARMDLAAGGEVVTIRERAPAIDVGSTKSGTTVKQDYLANVPTRGRTWSAALGAAAGSQSDALGTSFSGSTSLENSYLVDGINVTGVTLGAGFPAQGSQLINNFIQEIEIITGGYNAEFGRSTGGVVNVVTKTGSNQLHGSIFGTWVIHDAPVEPVVTVGSAISYVREPAPELDFGAEVGGPILADRIWFYVGVAPRFPRSTVTRKVSTRVDRGASFFRYDDPSCVLKNADGSCNGDAAVDPEGRTHATRGCEREGACESDGRPDVDPATNTILQEEVARHEDTDALDELQFITKLNFAVTPEHQGQLGLTGQAGRARQVAGGSLNATLFGTSTRTQRRTATLNTDLSARWTSKLFDNRTEIDAVFGWHRNAIDDSPITGTLPNDATARVEDTARSVYRVPHAALAAQGTIGAVGRNRDVPEADEVLRACTDGDPAIPDAFPGILNCPIDSYGLYSHGRYRDTLEQRLSGKLTVTQRVSAAGHHLLKAGVEIESNLLDDNRVPTGGYTADLWNLDGESSGWDIFRLAMLGGGTNVCGYDAGGQPTMCELVDDLVVHSATLNHGAFAQDAWSILPNLTLNAGLRYERQALRYADTARGTVDPVTMDLRGRNALVLDGLFAPRVGLVYDWTREGRSKVYASWGRFYESIPLDLNNRVLDGSAAVDTVWGYETQCGGPPSGEDRLTLRVASVAEGCPRSVASPAEGEPGTGNVPLANDVYASTGLFMPRMHAQRMDELTLGAEVEVLTDLRLGLAYQNRRIGEVIEDMSTDGFKTFFIGNPGSFDEGAERALMDEIAGTTDPDRRALLITRLRAFQSSREIMTRPRRDYDGVTLTAVKRFSRSFMVQGSYTWSSLRGNYPGLFSPDRVQIDPNITSQYDIQEYLANRCCKLPMDRPHMLKLDGYYVLDLERFGRVILGGRFRAQSGIPLTALGGNYPGYGPNESFVLPRGSFGRTPLVTQTDLQVGYLRKLGPLDVAFHAELFNVLNSQTEAQADVNYTTTWVDPIVNGERQDLAYLKGTQQRVDPSTRFAIAPVRNPNFLNPAARVAPLSVRLGMTVSF